VASNDRFYELQLHHRPALHGDVGSLLKIEGLVVGGEGAQAVLMLPGAPLWGNGVAAGPNVLVYGLTAEEWTDWLQRSDDPEILVMPAKAFHRKVRYEISGFIQQKVWLADGSKCMYCDVKMGKAPLTIDHFRPLELGGFNDTSNYLTACRKCNKEKGAMDPEEWCRIKHLSYSMLLHHLETRKLP